MWTSWFPVNVVLLISSRELEGKAAALPPRSWSLTYSPDILLAPCWFNQGGADGWTLFEGLASSCCRSLDLPLWQVEIWRVNLELQVLKKRGKTTRFPTTMPAANSPALGDGGQRLRPCTKVCVLEWVQRTCIRLLVSSQRSHRDCPCWRR